MTTAGKSIRKTTHRAETAIRCRCRRSNREGNTDEGFDKASKFGSRWWYYVAAYPISGLFLTVVTATLSPVPDAIAPVTKTLAAITGIVYVLGFPLLGIALVVLGSTGSSGLETLSLAGKYLGEAVTVILPLVVIALCLCYLYRHHRYLGQP